MMGRMGARHLLPGLVLALAACERAEGPAGVPPAQPVRGAAHLRVAPDPGPPPHEAPPVKTLWRRDVDGWRPVDRVLDVAPGGRAYVDREGRLVVDGRVVDRYVLPGLAVGPDGAVWYTRAPAPPATDVWRVPPGGVPEPVTTDGRSGRPFVLPDGTALWISSAPDGVAGWVRDGRRLTRGLDVPVPAFPEKTRYEGGRVVFHAGDRWWALDPASGRGAPR